MSRVGKNPVGLPEGVEATLAVDQITVKGPLGSLTQALHGSITVVKDGESLKVAPANDSRDADAMSGTYRALVNNMVLGVTRGSRRSLPLWVLAIALRHKGISSTCRWGFLTRWCIRCRKA